MTEQEHNELTTLYQVTVSDIREVKARAWTTTNSTVLLHAAAFAYANEVLEQLGRCDQYLLTFASLLLVWIAIWTLWKTMDANSGNRKRLDELRKRFGSDFNSCWTAYLKPSHTHPLRDLGIVGPMMIVVLLTCYFFLRYIWL